MALQLPQAFVDEMIAHAREDAPNECCGIIGGKEGRATHLYRARNAEASPYRYTIHPLDYRRIDEAISDDGGEVLVIYHSHTHTEAYPSPTDVRMARWPGSDPPRDMFPEAYYVLVSLMDEANPAVRAFRIVEGEVAEEPITRA